MKKRYIIIIIIIILLLLLNINNELFTNSITFTPLNNVCIVSFCKDEYELIEDFINYHAYLFGIHNIYIIDNNSTHPHVLNIYEQFKQKGGNLSYCSYYNQQGSKTTEIMNLNKHKYQYLIGLDIDEFINLRNSEDLSDITNYFNNLPKDIEKFVISCFNSVTDPNNSNYINNKISYPPRNINYFIDMGYTNTNSYTKKCFYKSNTFISTYLGNHDGNTFNNTQMVSDIVYYHYHHTGARRLYERACDNVIGFNYINSNDSLLEKIIKLSKLKITKCMGFHRVLNVLLYSIKEYVIIQYIKYFNRLPTLEELNIYNDLSINLEDIDKQFINLPIVNENTNNFDYNNLLFHDDVLNENDILNKNIIYDDRISKALLKIDKIII
jgi:hypothetical protein